MRGYVNDVLRVLAFAMRFMGWGVMMCFEMDENNFIFIGFVGMIDLLCLEVCYLL